MDPTDASDEYTRAKWAASYETQHFVDDNCNVYHLFKDLLLTKAEIATWFEKVRDDYGRAAHLLLLKAEHRLGEVQDMHCAAGKAKRPSRLRSF